MGEEWGNNYLGLVEEDIAGGLVLEAAEEGVCDLQHYLVVLLYQASTVTQADRGDVPLSTLVSVGSAL